MQQNVFSYMLLCVFAGTFDPCMHTVHDVYECLFSSSRAALPVLGGTIMGFCIERTWEEGDRRVNE